MQLLGGMGMGGVGGLSSLMGGRANTGQSESTPPSRAHSSPGPRASTTDSTTSATPRPITAATTGTGPATTSTPATGTAATPATAASAAGQNIQLSDLQNILTGFGGAGSAEPKENIDLSSALTPEVMIPILANKDVQERLIPFLPEGETLPKTEAELRATVQSPQFNQAMNSFSAALASGQLGPLMNQFNLGEDVVNAAAQGDVEAFVKAMQASLDKKNEAKGDEEENMEG